MSDYDDLDPFGEASSSAAEYAGISPSSPLLPAASSPQAPAPAQSSLQLNDDRYPGNAEFLDGLSFGSWEEGVKGGLRL